MKQPINVRFGIRALLLGCCALLFLLQPTPTEAKPRPVTPPWPELGKLFEESWNSPILHSNLAAETSTWVESFSGYALNRVATPAIPWQIPVASSNRTLVDLERGALRCFFATAHDAAQSPETAVLLTMVSTVGDNTFTWWTLAKIGGTNLVLLCPGQTRLEPCLSAPIDWSAGSWHLVALGYTPTNTTLFVDGQPVAFGAGLPAVPYELGPVTRLVVGSGLDGLNVADGQFEMLSTFTGRKRFHQMLGRPFGLTEDWEITQYWETYSKIAALGPISPEEEAALAQTRAQRRAELLAARQAESLTMNLDSPLQAGVECGTNDIYTVWMTNTVCTNIEGQGWTFSFDIGGGTNGAVYHVFSATNLAGNNIANSQWWWVTNGYACDTIALTNQSTNNSFYILGTPRDSDADGLTDAFERLVSKTNPFNSDTDGDGISDYDEVWLYHTDPNSQDSQGDGILDEPFRVWITSPSGCVTLP